MAGLGEVDMPRGYGPGCRECTKAALPSPPRGSLDKVDGMALMPRLRQLLRRPFSASTVGTRRPSPSRRPGDTVEEDALRAMLSDDPNDERAFHALAEIVRRRAAESPHADDPLSAPSDDVAQQRAADLAVWSLAEELAGHPRGWRPLLELGRLSLADDPEGAVRRLATAAERDATGGALAEALAGTFEPDEPEDPS